MTTKKTTSAPVEIDRGAGRAKNRKPFSTIMLVADLSVEDSSALRYAQQLARLQQAKLLLVHSIDPMLYAFPHGAPSGVLHDEEAIKELAKAESDAAEHRDTHHSIVERDRVCQDILDEANRSGASMLILATHGRTAAGRAALGAVARRLLVHAPCPVLTLAPLAGLGKAKADRWNNVLIATDFSAQGLAALHCAHHVALEQLTVLHSAQCGNEENCAHCLERLRLLAPLNESHTLPVDHVVASGEAAAVIAAHAAKLHPDLLVLGAPAKEMEGDSLEGSTVFQVIFNSHCPVLLVPAARRQSGGTLIKEVTYA